jgi:hypothetical protein
MQEDIHRTFLISKIKILATEIKQMQPETDLPVITNLESLDTDSLTSIYRDFRDIIRTIGGVSRKS